MVVESSGSFLAYVLYASPVVKLVLLILVIASIVSWTYILQKRVFLKRVSSSMKEFERVVWGVSDLGQFYKDTKAQTDEYASMQAIFIAGYEEYSRMQQVTSETNLLIDAAERAMAVTQAEQFDMLEANLPSLATIGSVSPYVGLFGTVWGIMTVFHSLSGAEQVSIAMVAPGIAEALVATAMGLFAAIPAVVAYNYYTHRINYIGNRLQYFQERFGLLLKQVLLARGEK